MKLPGPDHPITIKANPRRVRVLYEGHLIADTPRALVLREANYPAVQYIPREDVAMEFLNRTTHSTHCPYKGDASYFSIVRDGRFAENAVWSYEDPYPAMAEIKACLAFYPNQVEIEEVEMAAGGESIRDIIEHTESGSGNSQLEKWPTNVDGPGDSPAVGQPYKDTGAN